MTGSIETDERRENFNQVWSIYRFDDRLANFAPVLEMSAIDRDWLLRHHRQAKMRSREEIKLRAELDALLHGCGVLEVGFRAGTLTAEQSTKINALSRILHNEQVRLFSEERYPLRLPARLRERIDSDELVPREPSQASWYARILSLDARFRDSQLDHFLMMVDAFQFSGVGFDELKAAAGNKDAMITALTTPRAERTALQQALAGLERFLLFCGDLDELLRSAQSDAGEGAFDLYRYWFDVRHGELAEIVDNALSALVPVDNDDPSPPLPERAALTALFERAETTKR